MFSSLKDFFKGAASLEVTKSGEPTDRDLQVATAVLMLEMAGTDEDYAPEEIKACFAALEKQFDIDDTETLEIFEAADQARKDKEKLDHFFRMVTENFSTKQRQVVLAMVWKIVLADDIVENYEQKLASQMRQRLELTREQMEQAKDMAETGKV